MGSSIPLFKPAPPTQGALTTVTPDAIDQVGTAAQQLSGHDPAAIPACAGSDADTPDSPFAVDSQAGGERGAGSADDEQSDSAFVCGGQPMPRVLFDDVTAEEAEAARQHHLLRHSIPSEQRGNGVLAHFGADSIADAAKQIKKMSQRDLQAKFKAVYGARTFSNNNNWLRRKLLEAIGLDPSKGAAKKPGVGSAARRRRAPKPSPKPAVERAHRRSRAEIEADHRSVAEALLALGDLGGCASDDAEGSGMEEDSRDGCVPADSYGADERCRSPEAASLAAFRSVPSSPTRQAAPAAGFKSPAPVRVKAAPAPSAMRRSEVEAVEVAASMGGMFEWAARMQAAAAAAAAAAAGPHPALAAVLIGAPPSAMLPPGFPVIPHLPAAPGHPLALMQAMMGPVPPELYYRMLRDAAVLQHNPLTLLHGMHASHAAAGTSSGAPLLLGHMPMPVAPPLFSGSK